jgi:N-acetylglucosaminyldiphosphoundecaprenol N-acetyl-beta-D-mannosaminyltransferase
MRLLDILAGLIGLPVLGVPLLALSVLGLRFETREQIAVGRHARLFRRHLLRFREGRFASLANRLNLDRIGDCLSLLAGDLALVGPRPLAPLDPHALASYRVAARPGVISPFMVQQWARIAYEPEEAVDFAYVTKRSSLTDLGVLARALVARLHGAASSSALDRIDIDGIPVDNLTLGESVARIVTYLDEPTPRTVSFVNADCINRAARTPEYHRILQSSTLVLGDGVGVRLFSRLVGEPIRENVNGTDLFPRLCEALEGTPHSLYLLGGRPGVAAAVATWIQTRHSECRIAGFHHGYFGPEQEAEVIEGIRRSGAHLLLVAMGAPGQEVWLKDHLAATGARVGIGVGGLFDFFSGRIPRAPQWMREAGLEWVFRLSQEPRRLFWRYGPGNVEFMARALLAAIRPKAHPSAAVRPVH